MCARKPSAAAIVITGPTSVAGSAGSPTTSVSIAPSSISRTRDALSSCRHSSRNAEQRWPALPNAEWTASSTTCSGKAVESTIMALMPPVSAISGRIAPSRAASARLSQRPVAVEPVNTTPASAACLSAVSPNTRPTIGKVARAACGTPAACSSSVKASATRGVVSAGLATTVLPVTSAATTWPAKMASGKFHGLMQAHTPRGESAKAFDSPVGPGKGSAVVCNRRASAA